MKLGEILQKIMNEYPYTYEEKLNKPFKGDDLANFMRNEASKEFENIISDLSNYSNVYKAAFSPGKSQWVSRPWGGVRNSEVSTSFQNGFYLGYTLIDRKRVILSLNQAFTPFARKGVRQLKDRAKKLKENLKEIPESFSINLDLADDEKLLVAGNILSKIYAFDDLNDEKLLLQDLNLLMNVYNDLVPVYKNLFIKKIVPEKNVWQIWPGDSNERSYLWPKFIEKGYIGIGWFGRVSQERDYAEFKSIDELKIALKDTYPKYVNTNPQTVASMIIDFRDNIKIGDYVVAPGGYNEILGIGIIDGDYIPPNDSNNPQIDNEYRHLRKVKWKMTRKIEINKNKTPKKYFFQQRTLSRLNSDEWADISIESLKNKFSILKNLYDDFDVLYLKTEKGKEHLAFYDKEKKDVKNYFNTIKNEPDVINNLDEPILDYLLPLKRKSVSSAGFKTYSSFGYTENDYPELTLAINNLLNDLLNTDDLKQQDEIIKKFIHSPYFSGYQAGVISPVLHALNQDFLIINKKTTNTVNFILKILGNDYKISTQLSNYISSNNNLKEFLQDLYEYMPEFRDFHVFDAFCHWMCESKLGNYARGRPLPIEYIMDRNEPITATKVSIDPDLIKSLTSLLLNNSLYPQISGALNSGKHIIFTGAPGTGKTHLARDICEISTDLAFCEGYVLTTATSDWTTFDTIGGYMPDEKSNLEFHEGTFLKAIKENKWLIIDEINRADIDKAFGQLFTVLSGHKVELPFKDGNNSIKIDTSDDFKSFYDSKESTYYVGQNWRILATMNVYDKDYLFEMSYAFMRRFNLIYIDLPNDFEKLIDDSASDLVPDYVDKIKSLLLMNHYREIGPAIFLDIIDYILERSKFEDDSRILEDAIISYILPQFEGLEEEKIRNITSILEENLEDYEIVKKRLNDVAGFPLN